MHTRRDFLAQTCSILAGLNALPASASAVAWPPCAAAQIDLNLESSFVLYELTVFEREYLPILHSHLPADVHNPRLSRLQQERRLAKWQAAAQRLLQAPLTKEHAARRRQRGAVNAAQLVPVQAADFDISVRQLPMNQLDAPAYRGWFVKNGRVKWRIYPSALGWAQGNYQEALRDLLARAVGSNVESGSVEQEFCKQLPVVKKYLEEQLLHGDMCLNKELTSDLPLVADFDPDFAVQFLDVEHMHRVLQRSPGVRSDERAKRIQNMSGWFFRGVCLATGHGFVMEALANNHFLAIRGLLTRPEAFGSWTSFLPGHIFAVLYHKVAILQQLFAAKEKVAC